MIYQLGFFSDIGFSIKQALRTLSGNIAAKLYGYIVDLYNVFMYIARAEILEEEFIQGIYNKVGIILGIFMIFKLIFSLITSLVDPNKFNDEKKGFSNIIKRSVISIVLLGITPSIFDIAFDFQQMIVGTDNNTDNIIYKFIVGSAPSNDAESFGHIIAAELYFGFYTENDGLTLNDGVTIEYPDSGGIEITRHDYKYLKDSIINGKMQFEETVDYLSLTSGSRYVIKWDEIFAIGMAIIMIWILISYCIQIATRVIQLAYLQLIAPVPILSYISDPEGAFKKWTNQCVTTYMDLFIRLAIIYFIITVCTQILEAVDNVDSVLYSSTGLAENSPTMFWVRLYLIIGLLMFGKKVPELLKDLFPNMGGGAASFGFGFTKPKDVPGYGFAKGAAAFGSGLAIGGIAGMASGLRHGEGWHKFAAMGGGLFRGAASARTKGNIFTNAGKGMANVRAANARAYQRHHDGSTFFGRMMPVHAERTAAKFDRELEAYKDYASVADIVDKELEKNASVQAAMAAKEALMNRVNTGGPPPTATEIEVADTRIKTFKQTALQLEMNKIASGASDKNSALEHALKNAEEIKRRGIEEGYKGFSNSDDVTSYSDSFFDNKKSAKNATNNITSVSGDKNSKYKRSKANAEYKNKK